MTSQRLLLKTFVGVEILFGIVWPHTVVQEASFWGADLNYFDIGAIDEGDFYVMLILRDKSDGFKFALYVVYGLAQHNNKEAFSMEMAHTCSRESLPYIIGGDLNIMRHPDDKSTYNFDT
jgi:hypothetical protein